METLVDEISPDIYRLSTFVEAAGLVFNQYLVVAEQPLLFHCGGRQLFGQVRSAVDRVIPASKLRWISFGHVESDECGSMNEWLEVAPRAEVMHGALGCSVQLNDLADRRPRIVADGESVDLGGKTVRWIDTSHVPHGWESGLLMEESSGTLFCGDLFTAFGKQPALSDSDIVEPAITADEQSRFTALTPDTAPTIRRLAGMRPAALALMHGPAFSGNASQALTELAGVYDRKLRAALESADRSA